MRTCGVILALIGLAACRRDDAEQRKSASREAGRVAYRLSQETRHAAEKAREGLSKAGKEARRGWNEAKHESKAKVRKPSRPDER